MHASTPHPHRRALLLSAVLGLCPLALGAQPGARIWRCGNQYTDQPCASGTALPPAGTPNEDARAEADAATQRTRQQADAMARDRERREAAAAGRAPAVIEHRSPWASSDDEKDGSRTRLKRPQRPKTEKGRNPKTEGFTAKGSATGKSGNAR